MSALVVGLGFASLLLGLPLRSQEGAPPREESPGSARWLEANGSPVVFEGFVFSPEGAPAEGAVVVTSAGGQALVDPTGHYLVEAHLPLEAESVLVTAVGRGAGSLAATVKVRIPAGPGRLAVAPLSLTQGSACSPSWLPTFGGAPGVDQSVRALAVYDDGGGPALYVAGDFEAAGGATANRIARWDGSGWSALVTG